MIGHDAVRNKRQRLHAAITSQKLDAPPKFIIYVVGMLAIIAAAAHTTSSRSSEVHTYQYCQQ
jgi:hypothetical protein